LITDNGKEFTNNDLNQFCKDHKIIHRVAQSYKPTTNGLTERMNREIRKKIKAGFIRNNNLEWFSHLQTYCDNINNQRQSTTGYKPIELWKPLYKPVRRTRLPNPDDKPNDFSNDKELRQRIESRILNKSTAILKTQRIKKLQVGVIR
jgi:transposase InsO family protein